MLLSRDLEPHDDIAERLALRHDLFEHRALVAVVEQRREFGSGQIPFADSRNLGEARRWIGDSAIRAGFPQPVRAMFLIIVEQQMDGFGRLLDDIPGTPIFVSATQINATVPWEIAGRLTSNVVVEYNGVPSAPITVRVDSVTPALFTLNSTGRDQIAAINQDGTVNGPRTNDTRPAVQGSVVTLYATGLGVTSPSGITGSVSPTNQLLRITGPASVLVNGQNAVIEFIGAAPGLVTGVNQINVRLPLGISGTVPILITINGFTSPAGTVLVIQ